MIVRGWGAFDVNALVEALRKGGPLTVASPETMTTVPKLTTFTAILPVSVPAPAPTPQPSPPPEVTVELPPRIEVEHVAPSDPRHPQHAEWLALEAEPDSFLSRYGGWLAGGAAALIVGVLVLRRTSHSGEP